MNNTSQIKVSFAVDVLEQAAKFYRECGRTTQLNPDDTLVIAYSAGEIIGIVRLCREENEYVLRTMQVREDLQGQGLGRDILNKFKKLLAEQSISTVYCIPYTHLEAFYGSIDFKKIEKSEAPEFLQKRIDELHKKYPNKSVILMKRQDPT